MDVPLSNRTVGGTAEGVGAAKAAAACAAAKPRKVEANIMRGCCFPLLSAARILYAIYARRVLVS